MSKLKAGKGYRFLDIGDVIMEGDECFEGSSMEEDAVGIWGKSPFIGHRTEEDDSLPHRRKIEAPAKQEPTKPKAHMVWRLSIGGVSSSRIQCKTRPKVELDGEWAKVEFQTMDGACYHVVTKDDVQWSEILKDGAK